jgi:hypothetical protein
MLLLTKDVNEELKKAGLKQLTIIRNDSGYVEVCGRKCHKPVMTFGTIKVGTKLTKEEREVLKEDYIFPLITEFKKDFLAYITIKSDNAPIEAVENFIKEIKEKYSATVKTNARGYHAPSQVESYQFIIKNKKYDTTWALLYRFDENDKMIKKEVQCDFNLNKTTLEKYQKEVEEFVGLATASLDQYISLLKTEKEYNEKVAKAQENLIQVCSF